MHSPIFAPVVALVAWTLFMLVWMLSQRVPTIMKMKMRMDRNAPRGQQMNELPPSVRWKADNYNHLFEQPTLFYAVALVIGFTGHGDGLNLYLAWTYVGLRVVHSLVQSLSNIIPRRFAVFVLSSLVLIWLTINAGMAVL